MKGKVLSFSFIYFSESGVFNALRWIQIEKFSPISNRASSCVREHIPAVPSFPPCWGFLAPSVISGNRDKIAWPSGQAKELIEKLQGSDAAFPEHRQGRVSCGCRAAASWG
jgi:hypothetical protein